MNELLQEAIDATRSGNAKEAQLLLAKNLEENPEDAQSWYLLSILVDSPDKQALYLNKTLALDPHHALAQERLALFTAPDVAEAAGTAEISLPDSVVISDESFDYLAQSEGDSLPNWLAGDADSIQLDKMGITEDETAAAAEIEAAGPDADETLPDWLQDNTAEEWPDQEEQDLTAILDTDGMLAVEVDAVADTDEDADPSQPAAQKKPKKKRTKQEEKSRLNVMLGLLIVAMILVFVALIFYGLAF